MPITDLVAPEAILPALKVISKKQALQELAARAAALTGQNERAVFEVLLQREKLGTTAVGYGVAIPHGKLPKLDKLFGLFARLERPIDFEAMDGQPVDLVFLLLAPEGAGADHLKALARIARLLRWPVDHGEGLQVLHYRPGAEYKPHYDYFDPKEPGTAHIVRRGGQRVATLVMYLNNPLRGGGTTFPDVGLEVAPQRGHAVFFAYERPHPATRTLHGGAPVIEGEKWVATKWLRQREFA